jgi:hypothetical protein
METLIYTITPESYAQFIKNENPSTTFHVQTNLAASIQCLKENTFQKIIIEIPSFQDLQQTTLHNLYSILKPGGTLEVYSVAQLSADKGSFNDFYTIAGFKETSQSNISAVLTKPNWAGKGVASLKKKNPTENASAPVKINAGDDDVFKNSQKVAEKPQEQKANPFAKFSVQNTDNKEIINEDNLLENEEGYNRLGADEPCSTKPKACANCSCGRAELEAQEAEGTVPKESKDELIKKIEEGKTGSSCGNCYLGDAFRCGTCPYKGLPAFKPGDKIKLDLTKDNLGGVLKEENDVVVSNGKVKLQI